MAARQADNASTSRADRRFVEETGAAAEVAALAEPVLEDLGLRLVRVLMSGRDGGTVQIMVDRAESDVTVEDCADASRAISPLLDAHDPGAIIWRCPRRGSTGRWCARPTLRNGRGMRRR